MVPAFLAASGIPVKPPRAILRAISGPLVCTSLAFICLAFICLAFICIDSAADSSPDTITSPLFSAAPVQPMASHVQLPGDASSATQTSTDRKIAVVPSLQDDTRSELPNDPRHDQQWSFYDPAYYRGASSLFAARAHNSGNFPVIVAVVDSGLMLSHEDLQVLPGYDFISDSQVANDGDGRDNDPSDPGDWVTEQEIATSPVSSGCTPTRSKWHGTAVSGIIGAISDNQKGIAGGAPSVSLVPVRVTGKCGGYIQDLVDGVRWAAGLAVAGSPLNEYPAKIINLSVGFPGACPATLQNAIDAAVDTGAAVVVAATNSAAILDTEPQSPASCENVTTVGAVLRDGSLAPYSAVGSNLSLLAPGGSVADGIITTQNGSETTPTAPSSYGFHFGTSMAAAHVSATYALLLSMDPSLTSGELATLVRRSVDNSRNTPGCPVGLCGAGRLNAKRAADLLVASSGLPADDATTDLLADEDVSVLSASSTPPATAQARQSAATSGIGRIDLFGSLPILAFLIALQRRGGRRKGKIAFQ